MFVGVGIAGCSSDSDNAPPKDDGSSSDTSGGAGGDPTADQVKTDLANCGEASSSVQRVDGAQIFDCTDMDDDHSTYLYLFDDKDAQKSFVDEKKQAKDWGVIEGPTWVVLALDQRVVDLAVKDGGKVVVDPADTD